MKAKLLIICLLFCCGLIWAQSLQITITDPDGKPLENVKVTAGIHQTISDARGLAFLPATADSVHFSRLGYQSREVRLKEIHDHKVVLQPSEIHLPQILVVATGISRDLPTLNTRIIHPDTDLKMGDSASLLRQVSSLSSQDTQLVGEHQSLSILGALSRHTLVLLDGVPLNAAGEAFDFSKIPLNQIERIEILKGNVSALVGQSAIGGAVNIISKKERRERKGSLKTGLNVGSYRMHRENLDIGYQIHKYSFNASYDKYRANNDFKYQMYVPEKETLKRTHNAKAAENYYFKGSYLGKKQHLEYSLNQGNFQRELPGPTSFLALYDDAHLTGHHAYHAFRYNIYHRALNNELKIFYQTNQSIYKNLNSTLPRNPAHYRQKQHHAGLQNRLNLDFHKARFTLLAEDRRVAYDLYQFPLGAQPAATATGRRDSRAAALIYRQDYRLHFTEAQSQLALRTDYADKDWHFSRRIEQNFRYENDVAYSLGMSFGDAFALPSMYDMYWIGDSETLGNPELKSEKSRAFSLNFGFDHPIIALLSAYHISDIKNLIQWRVVSLFGGRWQPFNIGRSRIQNLETELSFRPLYYLEVSSGFTFTHAKDKSRTATHGKYLAYTPKEKLILTLKLGDEKRRADLRYSYTGHQFSTPDNKISPLKAYATLDLALHQNWGYKKLSFSAEAKLNNILDKRYEVYAHTPQPGRNWSLGFSSRLNI